MIHKTAIIDPKAKISSSVKIGPYTVIGPNVEIHDNTIIQSHVNINGHTVIGKSNKIYPFTSIGSDPQDKKYKDVILSIGVNNLSICGYIVSRYSYILAAGICISDPRK